MCTFIIAWQAFADTPVVVAANRDEAYDRPAEPPSMRDGEPAVLAPRDAEAGGTWIGVNEHGVLAALTNRWVDADLAGERSRGLLVGDVLQERTAEDAGRRIERAVQDDEYEGFNLVVADANAALYFEWDGALEFTQFDPGVHVVVNVGADGRYVIPSFRQGVAEAQAERADQLRADLEPDPGETATAWHDRAAAAIADHEYGVCVHGDGFGTRSSSLIAVGREGISYRFAAGPPCETEYRDVSPEGQV